MGVSKKSGETLENYQSKQLLLFGTLGGGNLDQYMCVFRSIYATSLLYEVVSFDVYYTRAYLVLLLNIM